MNQPKLNTYVVGAACALFLVVANATAQTAIPLGTASTYGVLAGSTITNTGASVVTGDVGLSPGTAVTGFPPGIVSGSILTAAAAAGAKTDLLTAYNLAAGQSPATVSAELGGQTLTAGVYNSAAGTFAVDGILTLDGGNNPNAVFIFQTASTLTTAAGAPGTPASQIILTNGAQSGNVFWQVGSSATLGTYSLFQGNILALTSITVTTGATVNGRVLALNGAVTLDTNTITVPGSIQVVKNTVGGDGTFAFTSNFGLTSLTTSSATASQTFSGLTAGGTYSVSETVPSGWTQTSAVCTNGTPAAITVVGGATTVCTFTNTKTAPPLTGSIQVVKNTVGGNGTFAFTSNFGLTSLTTTSGTASLTFSGLTAGGSYSVSETVPSGWTQTSAVCTNGTPAAITVVGGATTVCTFTNTKTAPPLTGSIQVVKNTVGGNGTFAFTSNFGLTSLTTTSGTASQTFSGLTAGGSYSVSETVPSGWTQTSAACTNGTPAAITVASGATTICTFTNTKAAPLTGSIQGSEEHGRRKRHIRVHQQLRSDVTDHDRGTASQTFSGLTAGGSYSVSETVPSGWTQTSAACTNGTPAAITVVSGATTVCTFTNTKAAPPHGVDPGSEEHGRRERHIRVHQQLRADISDHDRRPRRARRSTA